jgi:hypothetical protein
MRTAVRLGAAFLAVFVIGVGLGLAIPRLTQRTYRLRDPTPIANRRYLNDYMYPGARSLSSYGGDGHVLREGVELSGFGYFHLATPDDYDKVVAFYADRLRMVEGPETEITDIRGQKLYEHDEAHRFQHYDDQAGPYEDIIGDTRIGLRLQENNRPLRQTSFAMGTFPYAIVVFISRGREEKETHITLYHNPNNAFVKGQKPGG